MIHLIIVMAFIGSVEIYSLNNVYTLEVCNAIAASLRLESKIEEANCYEVKK